MANKYLQSVVLPILMDPSSQIYLLPQNYGTYNTSEIGKLENLMLYLSIDAIHTSHKSDYIKLLGTLVYMTPASAIFQALNKFGNMKMSKNPIS